MSSEDDAADKSHEASAQKLEKARRKGEIARAPDLLTACAYAGFLATAALFGETLLTGLADALLPFLDHPDRLARALFSDGSSGPVGGLMLRGTAPVLPWILLPAALVLTTLVAQRGLMFTPSKLELKLSRLSPIANAKNKYGRRGLFEFAKSFAKLLPYALCLALFLRGALDRLVSSMTLAPAGVVAELADVLLRFMTLVLMIAIVLGAIDALWQHKDHLRRNRMSRKELQDEHKEAEGDPYLKQQRRARAAAVAQGNLQRDVSGADVVLVNPTHYAVALKWSRKPGAAPECVAKGTDARAQKIREIAAAAGVPIRSDPPTARALYATVSRGQEVPVDLYRAVAAAIRYAEAMRLKARERRSR
ncbi:EscU/YscU/HrcU family type III secretion system export apparatus switch protein [Litorisediminicola beolgyonensis]|uniref:Flagellar biosynthesis protein FlhB n=1 Tax=Litorisediminicola beolgyonensis TaxID=1173614 RepID=A0ABW3ZHQ2_9RHOB